MSTINRKSSPSLYAGAVKMLSLTNQVFGYSRIGLVRGGGSCYIVQ